MKAASSRTINFLCLCLLTLINVVATAQVSDKNVNLQRLNKSPYAYSAQPFILDSTKIISKQYDYSYQQVMVEGGDGFKLKTCIYLPKGDGPWPVVITRTPYAFLPDGDSNPTARLYATRGIGYITQYCRGKGGSEGPYEPNVNERVDGLALVNWVANQPWCKSIGLFGESYTALTCWIIADAVPQKVKGIFVQHYGVDRYLSAYSYGMFRQDILTAWTIDNAKEITTKPSRADKDHIYFDQMRYMPHLEMDKNLLGVELPWYRDWISHTEYKDPYWHQGVWETLRNIPAKIKVPMVIVAGHFDHHQEGTILGYNLLNEETKKKSRLIVGSWNHSHIITPLIHQPKHALDIDLNVEQFNWFYSILKLGINPDAQVKVYAIGEDAWHTLNSWPNEVDDIRTYYLTSSETHRKNKQLLSVNPEIKTSTVSYQYDPANPVLSVGGETLFNSETRRGSQLQPETDYRPDVLSFLSEPMQKPLLISGSICLTLYVSSDCDDTAFTYKISEQFNDGKTYNIRTGITTLAFCNDPLGNREKYKPGKVVKIRMKSLPIMWQLQAGSRIRVDISSSDFPQFSIHSNYAGGWAEQTKTRKANNTIFMGGKFPSKIEIPYL